MRKISIFLSIFTLTVLFQSQAWAGDLVVNATGSSAVEKYFFNFYVNGAGSRENDEVKALPRARDLALENAKKAFNETCTNSKNGTPSRVVAVLVPAPGEFSTCNEEWSSADKGTITCNARARGVCTVKDNKDIRVSENHSAPARVEVVEGTSFLIDASGVAHRISAGAAN